MNTTETVSTVTSPTFLAHCLCNKLRVPTVIGYGLENLHKDEGDVVTVCFICEHKRIWTGPQAKARLRRLIAGLLA
jgi:hypothetical protein